MNKLMNKNFIQKIVIAILIVLSFNFVVPTFSCAYGGLLWTVTKELLTALTDTALYWVNYYFVGLTPEQENAKYAVTARFDKDTEILIDKTDREGATEIRTNVKSNKEIPIIKYGPDMIFSNQVPGLDANYINPTKTESGDESRSITATLQQTIAEWYIALRNLVVVCLLAILLYVAIRMIISSTASDKAKYKKMLMDWLISFCLVFFMHYIMSFTMSLIDIISENLGSATTEVKVYTANDGNKEHYFYTNIMGYCRFMIESDEGIESMGYMILYIGLIIYTVKFTWEYMKRSIKMAFLTLMAPLVTLTYAIDKMGDGKAQAFNAWLKEFIFTALTQPFHLLVYAIFMTSGMEIAANNPLYAVLFIAFLSPAEKLLRKFFGFDKEASGGSSFAGGFGGAAAFNMLKGAVNKGAQGIQHAKGGGGNNSQIRQKNNNLISDPNAPKGNLDSFKTGNGNNNGNENENMKQLSSEDKNKLNNNGMHENQSNIDSALSKYSADGYGKNADGEYFNPWTDEYDSNYDPHNDDAYKENDEALNRYSADGYGKNADGEYFNPWTDEYDSNYDPHNDKSYNVQEKQSNQELPNNTNNNQQRFRSQQSVQRLANSGSSTSSKVKSGARANIAKGIGRVALRGAIGTAKIAGKMAGAATLGAIGLGIGIAGDDLEDVFKYATAGATLGYTALPAMAKNAVNDVKNVGRSIRNEFELGAYGSTGSRLRQQERDIKSDKNLRAQEIEKLTEENGGTKPSRQQVEERMQQVAEYTNAGITNSSEMHKAMKVEKEINEQLQQAGMDDDNERNSLSRRQAIEIAKIAEPYSKQDLRDENKVNDLRNNMIEKLTKGENGLSKKEATASCENIINNIKKIKGV